MKRATLVLLVFIVMLFNVGCSLFPDGKVNEVEVGNKTKLEEVDGHIEGQLVDSVYVDADVIKNDGVNWKQITASGKDYSKEQADKDAEYFKFNSQIKETEAFDAGGTMRYLYNYEDGGYFSGDSYKMSYICNREYVQERQYSSIFAKNNGLHIDFETALPLKELDDFPLKEAIEQVRSLCEQVNISLAECEPVVYVVDAEHMNKVAEQNDIIGYYKQYNQTTGEMTKKKITWAKEDEVYYLVFPISMDGAPILVDGFGTSSVYSNGSSVRVAIGKKGIVTFQADRLYDVDSRQELEGEICSAAEALDVVAAAYQYSDSQACRVNQIQLVYVPIGKEGEGINENTEYTVRPYWACSMTIKVSGKEGVYTRDVVTVVDAVSGIIYKGK